MARKIVVYIATSADGFIARKDGGVDWLDRPNTAGDYGMGAFYKTIDTVLFGRKTYDVALAMSGSFSSKIKYYVFTHNPPATGHKKIQFVNEPVKDFAARLRQENGKDIWMMGGGGIIASFLDAGEIDEFIIHVIPTFIGEGIPLIEARHRNVELELLESHAYKDGVVKLHYRVKGLGSSALGLSSKSKTKAPRPKAKAQRPKPKDPSPKTQAQRPKPKDPSPKTQAQRPKPKDPSPKTQAHEDYLVNTSLKNSTALGSPDSPKERIACLRTSGF